MTQNTRGRITWLSFESTNMFINLKDLLKIQREKAQGSVPCSAACIFFFFFFLQHVFNQFPPPFTLNRARGDFQCHGFNFCILLRFLDRVKGLPRALQQVAVKLALWVQFLAPTRCSPYSSRTGHPLAFLVVTGYMSKG